MTLASPVSLRTLCMAIEAGTMSAARVLADFAARDGEVEPAIGAFVASDWTAALAAGPEVADRPLHGLPVGVKDIFATAALPTGYGSRIYEGRRPANDAAMVRLLRDLGATLPVKTTTTEFAFLHPTATCNPWAIARSPGGSSAGSAAAVAAGLLPAAIGSQTAGSTIRPASFCGVAGFKPSFGVLPTEGLKPFAPTLDTVGLFTAGIDDMRLFWSILQKGRRSVDLPPPADLVIILLRTPWDDAATAPVRSALETGAAALRQAGIRLREIALPSPFVAAQAAHGVIQGYEAVIALADERRTYRAAFSEELRQFLDEADAITPAAYQEALAQADEARRCEAALFAGKDAMLTFASAEVAPPRTSTGSPVFNRLWTLLGVPCVSVPGLTASELPIGLQLIGPTGRDDALLATATVVADALVGNPVMIGQQRNF